MVSRKVEAALDAGWSPDASDFEEVPPVTRETLDRLEEPTPSGLNWSMRDARAAYLAIKEQENE